jgi:hypothetical protein
VFEVVAKDEVVAIDRLFGCKGEGDGVAVVGVLRGGEVGRRAGSAFGEACGELVDCYGWDKDLQRRRASVVFDADVQSRVEVLCGNVDGLLAVDVHGLVFGCVVGRSGGDPEHVFFVVLCHGGASAGVHVIKCRDTPKKM